MGLAEKLASSGCWVRLAVNGTMAGQTIEALGGALARLAPSLRAVGIEMIQGRGGKERKRTWAILYKADQ